MPAPKTVAAILALATLATGILVNVDPMQNLLRAAIAFFAGLVVGQIWSSIFGDSSTREPELPKEQPKAVPPQEEANDEQPLAA